MPDEKKSDTYKSPVPVWPRNEAVMDASRIEFEWEPVEGVTRYRLQVARDVNFQDLVLEHEVEDASGLRAEDEFEADEELYYWRVISRDSEGREHGYDSIESFICSTAERADKHLARPDERLGPPGELFKGAAATATAEVTQDPEDFQREVEMGVAHEGIPAGQILGIALAIGLAIVLIVVSLIQYTRITAQSTRYGVVGASGYPELREVQAEAVRQLGQYDVIDEEQGVYQIPIERAMDLMANEAYRQGGAEYSAELPLIQRDTTSAP